MFFKTKEIIKEVEVNHVDTLTTEELENKLLERYGDIPEQVIDKDLEDRVIADLRNVDGFHLFLQSLMNKDIIRYFSAQEDIARHLTRGAFQRTLYLKNRMKAKTKLNNSDNKRYAK